MKKIILFVLVSLIFIEKVNSTISDSIFMTIGNRPITKSDIVNEIKLILILNNESYSDEKRDNLHALAVKSTIKRNIKQIELERNNFYMYSEADLQKELSTLASNIYVDIETLKNICESNELDFSIIENQIKVELYWNSLIFELYKNKLSVNPDQIEERLKSLQSDKKIQEYLISEIVIRKTDDSKLESTIKNLKDKIKIEGFENVAKNISISESSLKGGDLGWINENVLSDNIKSILLDTPVGSLSAPVDLPDGGLLFFKIRDKRDVEENLSLEEMKNRLVSSEKTKILNMHSLSHYDKVRRSISIKFYQ